MIVRQEKRNLTVIANDTWQSHECYPLRGYPVQVVEIGQGHDSVLAERTRGVEDARSAGLVDAVIKIVTYEHDTFLNAPSRRVRAQIGSTLEPIVDHVGLVDVSAQ